MASVELINRKDYTPIGGPPTGGLFHLPPPSELAEIVTRIRADIDHASAGIAELTRLLAAPRLEVEALGGTKPNKNWRVSYGQERNIKLTVYAKKAWEESHLDAVKAEVAELIVQLVAVPAHSAATLALLYEFVAGGFGFVQNALYFACGDDPSPLMAFLSQHIEARSPTILSVLQQLCENHHGQWQALMHSDTTSCLLRAVDHLVAIYDGDSRIFSVADLDTLCDILMFLSEACQGPCLSNQDELVASRAVAVCTDMVLPRRDDRFDDAVTPSMQIRLAYHATHVILAMLEGRADAGVQDQLVARFPPLKVMGRITANYRDVQDTLAARKHHFLSPLKLLEITNFSRTSSDAVVRATPAFKGAINLIRIVKYLLHRPPEASANSVWSAFAAKWAELQGNALVKEALAYFESHMMSVEVTRFGSIFTVHFLKPKVAKLFNPELQERLIDAMDIGTDQALDVLVSEAATDIVDQLNVMKYLSKNQFYKSMNRWAPGLRRTMLRLCFYINFVMLLTLPIKDFSTVSMPADVLPPADKPLAQYFISLLGFVLLLMSLVLWVHYSFSALCFNYSKQQVSSVNKLSVASGAAIRTSFFSAFAAPFYYLQLFIAMFVVVFYLKLESGVIKSCVAAGAAWIIYALLVALREVSGLTRFTINSDATTVTSTYTSMITFAYNVLIDTSFTPSVMVMGTYALCFLLGFGLSIPGLAFVISTGPWGLLFFGFPLLDILATNESLRFIVQAMRSNFGKLGATAIFGAVVIYIFSLIGFYFLQLEMTTDAGSQCATLLQCYASYIRFGLLDGGGIGDYMSSTLDHTLDYSDPMHYFQRLVYDMAFYVIIITLFLNMIQGIIIDAFTSVREASEQKAAMRRDRCLVCNRARNVIELAGMEKGLLNNFARHTEREHNLFHYFFYIQYVLGKDDKERNGIESYVHEKLKTSDMSWIPRV
ncbi:type I inositol triphosphate receptor [Achlya hypogyna]|uniref:Type I inositol triphosphate receptor n=1 Tax=Achlya hypogyna TaxID=1202772 RepID=A0A1V9Y9G5_ACHHY|nr:type I inositol triphosphate receptor [Achlya hypogyna]